MNRLYIKFKTTALDEEHEFKATVSPIYGCKEYVWNGYLKKNWDFQLVDENGIPVPYLNANNCGITTDTELTNKEFLVKNALDCYEGERVYHYMNENSTVAYGGKWRKVFLYVRVYDNETNCRWFAINLQHDVEDDINRLKTIGLITDDMSRDEALAVLASKDR